jgi:hypothetical protein
MIFTFWEGQKSVPGNVISGAPLIGVTDADILYVKMCIP